MVLAGGVHGAVNVESVFGSYVSTRARQRRLRVGEVVDAVDAQGAAPFCFGVLAPVESCPMPYSAASVTALLLYDSMPMKPGARAAAVRLDPSGRSR